MKKIIIVFIFFITVVRPVFAVESTPSAKAQDLLDRVATKVAEISAKLQKSYAGRVKSLGTATLTLTVGDANRSVITNDATSFFRIRAGNKTEINFGALKTGDDLAAIGTIDPQTGDLSARQIIAKIKREVVTGKITAVDKAVVTLDTNQKLDLDGTILKQASLSGLSAGRQEKLASAKLADFKEGTTVFALAYSPDEKTGIFSVLKALLVVAQ